MLRGRDQRRRITVDRKRVGSRLECRGEALEWVAGVQLRRAYLGVELVWLARRVEVVGVPATTQSGVARLLRQPMVAEHERPVDGQALRNVTGDRVAVQQRRVAVYGAAFEEAGAELDRAAFALDHQATLIRINGEYPPPVAVVDLQLQFIALDHD